MEFNGTDFRESFALKLRKIRLLKGKTQEKFAEELGISVSTYKKIEERVSDPSVEFLYQLKKVTGFPADFFLCDEEGDMAMSWAMIQNCSEYDKIELLARLIKYFGSNKCIQMIKNCREES